MNEHEDKDKEPVKPFYVGGRGPGRGRGPGMGRGRRRGRPRVAYPVDFERTIADPKGTINLTPFELKILKLAEIEGLTQNQIAKELDISQTSVWRYLNEIRTKIAKVLLNHHIIEVNILDQ